MSGQYMVDAVTVLIEGVIYIENSAARITEHRIYALFQQTLHQNIRTI
jgi:hypothetical protein